MAVVLTRPRQEAEHWAARLRRHGIGSIVLPLLEIGPAPDASALQRAVADLPGYAAVMFVSANAVQGFLAVAGGLGRARAWAPGPGTRDALLAAGVAPACVDAPAADATQFDSEALWQQVSDQLHPGDRLLLVRGGDPQGRSQGRDWLARQLADAGVRVDTVVAYTRGLPAWDEAQFQSARTAAVDGSLWLFSSSESVRNLAQLLHGEDWRGARALATHPRIAEAARALGFGEVVESRPTLAEVIASIESHR